jgi:dTDP-4-amino-4,6-dideoxygalactose transaminase
VATRGRKHRRGRLPSAPASQPGGAPRFAEPLHVGTPNVGERERFLRRVNDLLDRRWLTNHGQYVVEFEEAVAARAGVAHCVAMCNGTIALEIAIRALGLSGEVIVPSFTFIATAHALQWQEITPVFADVDPRTHTIDPDAVARLITPRTTGVIGVHLWGRPCNVVALEELARDRGLKLLFDAAHAFGCSYQGEPIGSFGEAEIFSFHATKVLNTFEGGAIVTNDGELAEKARFMSNFGFAGLDDVRYLGTNGKMSEIAAAMGLTVLESLDACIETNRRNHALYRERLSNLPGLAVIDYDSREQNNYQYVVVDVDANATGVSRDSLVERLRRENILARRYFFPGCHRMEPYRSLFPNAGLLLPHTELLADRLMALPTGPTVDADAVVEVCSVIEEALQP